MFNWDEFKNEKVAVWCDTEDKAKEFVEECHERGMKWRTGSEDVTHWSWNASKTCYTYSFRNDNELTYCDKPFFENRGCKIIKWEGEDNMKFKVGDKVVMSDGGKWLNGEKYRTIIECCVWDGKNRYELSNSNLYWYDGEIKLYKPQTEFTFQEVIARNIPGVYVNCSHPSARLKKIEIQQSGSIMLHGTLIDGTGIRSDVKFKLQQPKERITIYKVEHKKDGKKYDFISSQLLQVYNFVVCDTSQGKSYGRIVDAEDRELTESEIKQYKECWRA